MKTAILRTIEQAESAQGIAEIRNIKKLSGFEFHYRIRIGDHRIGLFLEGDTLFFVTFDHRKDIYKKFP